MFVAIKNALKPYLKNGLVSHKCHETDFMSNAHYCVLCRDLSHDLIIYLLFQPLHAI